MQFARHTEVSWLSPVSTVGEIEAACTEVKKCGFAALTVPPMFLRQARNSFAEHSIRLGTVIGYPFGFSAIESKLAEIVLAMVDGADELNVVVNNIALKNQDWQYLAKELNTILSVVKKTGKTLSIVLEESYFSVEELVTCCDLYGAAGVDFLQLGTGTIEQSEEIDTVAIVRKHLANAVRIKVARPTIQADTGAIIAKGVERIVVPGTACFQAVE